MNSVSSDICFGTSVSTKEATFVRRFSQKAVKSGSSGAKMKTQTWNDPHPRSADKPNSRWQTDCKHMPHASVRKRLGVPIADCLFAHMCCLPSAAAPRCCQTAAEVRPAGKGWSGARRQPEWKTANAVGRRDLWTADPPAVLRWWDDWQLRSAAADTPSEHVQSWEERL